MLKALKAKINEKFERLKRRETELQRKNFIYSFDKYQISFSFLDLRDQVKQKKSRLEESKSRLISLRNQASSIKTSIHEKLEYYRTCQ